MIDKKHTHQELLLEMFPEVVSIDSTYQQTQYAKNAS